VLKRGPASRNRSTDDPMGEASMRVGLAGNDWRELEVDHSPVEVLTI
jgi:hypothetical protein